MTTAKEKYEARKKLREIDRDGKEPDDQHLQAEYTLELFDRFVSALELAVQIYQVKK